MGIREEADGGGSVKRMVGDFFKTKLPRNVDLVITSPPLTLLEQGPLYEIIGRLAAVLVPTGWILLDMPSGYSPHLFYLYDACRAFDLQWKYVIYQESLYVAGETQALYCITWREVWKQWKPARRVVIERSQPMSHRCEFCPDWIAALINDYSATGDTVLDPFCGTGTVPRVAEELGRLGYGIDIRDSAESG